MTLTILNVLKEVYMSLYGSEITLLTIMLTIPVFPFYTFNFHDYSKVPISIIAANCDVNRTSTS